LPEKEICALSHSYPDFSSFQKISRIDVIATRYDDDLPCGSCGEYGGVVVVRLADGSVDLCESCLYSLRERLTAKLCVVRMAACLREVAADLEALVT
jgi:hypothetical protein